MKCRKLLQALLSSFLAFLGVSCQQEGDEYGCPTADFYMKGSVVNQKGEPVPGVELKTVWTEYLYENQGDSLRTYDTIYDGIFTRLTYIDSSRVLAKTDEKGDYSFMCDYYDSGSICNYSFEVDGILFRFVGDTSLYEPFDTIVPSKSIQLKGGDGDWYGGKASINLDVVLKDKE